VPIAPVPPVTRIVDIVVIVRFDSAYTINNPTTDTIVSMIVQVAKVWRIVRLKYSLNNQNPPSLTCENVMLPAPMARTSSSGRMAECCNKGSNIPTVVNAATVEDPVQMRNQGGDAPSQEQRA